MPIIKPIELDALPTIFSDIETVPKSALIQCRHKEDQESLIGLRVDIFDQFSAQNVAGIFPLEGPSRGKFMDRAHFSGFGSFDVSGLISINVRLNPRSNVAFPSTGFLYLDPNSKAIWMWSTRGDDVLWVCIHAGDKAPQGRVMHGSQLIVTGLLELGEPVLEPIEKGPTKPIV
jgi:hypothetical protein